jgi:hypothetical protein
MLPVSEIVVSGALELLDSSESAFLCHSCPIWGIPGLLLRNVHPFEDDWSSCSHSVVWSSATLKALEFTFLYYHSGGITSENVHPFEDDW